MFNKNFLTPITYEDELNKVKNLIIDSYELMVSQEDHESNLETFLRNVLVAKYLRKLKHNYSIGYLGFEIESGEISVDSRTVGFIDIKVINLGKKDILDENEYFAIECKRVNNSSRSCRDYIDNGILRFVKSKYSKEMNIASMIAFVEDKPCIDKVIKINDKLSSHSLISTKQYLTRHNFKESFEYSFLSIHERNQETDDIKYLVLL